MNETVAIIPARGGSKRIPRKNIRPFLNKPIIGYSIEAAFRSNIFDEIMVSTDDREIAEIAVSYGAKVPFLRSVVTSNDQASTVNVLEEVLIEYRRLGKEFKYCCCIYPAAPLVSHFNLIKGLEMLKQNNADSVIPVVRFGSPIQRALKIEDGRLLMVCPDYASTRSQDLMPMYYDAGQFYWCKVESLLLQKKIFTENSEPIELSELEVQDINNEEDWAMAEVKYRIIMKKIGSSGW